MIKATCVFGVSNDKILQKCNIFNYDMDYMDLYDFGDMDMVVYIY